MPETPDWMALARSGCDICAYVLAHEPTTSASRPPSHPQERHQPANVPKY